MGEISADFATEMSLSCSHGIGYIIAFMSHDDDPAGANREVELKFEVGAEDVKRLGRAPWMKSLRVGRAVTRRLDAIYFDTPSRSLWRNGLALRVRKEGRRFVQCVKSRGDARAGAFARFEWETPVAGPAPDPEGLGASEALQELMREEGDTFLPVFETLVTRTSRRLAPEDGTVVSCDIDAGSIRAGEASEPVYELELELKSGDPRHLFAVARLIVETVPARLIARSKAERGYALAAGDARTWQKMAPVELDSEATGEEALAATVHRCLDHLIANQGCVLGRLHVEGVHQMRVAGRRLRSSLSIYRKMLPAEQHADLDAKVKAVVNALGPARDFDVFIEEVLEPVAVAMPDEAGLRLLRARAEDHRDAGYREAEAMIRSPGYTGMLLDLGAWLHERGWRNQPMGEHLLPLFHPARALAAALLAKRHKKLRKAGRHIRHMTVEERHQLRIAAKKVRYAAEFFRSLFPGRRVEAYVERLVAIQDVLGRFNDLAVARGLLDRLVETGEAAETAGLQRAAGLILGWYARGAADHEDDLEKTWENFAEGAPFWEQ